MKTIFAVGANMPGTGIECIPFFSDRSLLDADVVVFAPEMSALCATSRGSHRGKPCLFGDAAHRLCERLDHWRAEIADALDAGKTVFLMLSAIETIYVSECVGNEMQMLSNYRCIPHDVDHLLTPRRGHTMCLSAGGGILADYWRRFERYSGYHVAIAENGIRPLVVSRDGRCVFGALLQRKGVLGNLVMLPDLNLSGGGFSVAKVGGMAWTKEAHLLGNALVACLLGIDDALRTDSSTSPTPDWVNAEVYALPGEGDLDAKIRAVDGDAQRLVETKAKYQAELERMRILKRLLYEKGTPLENAIILALKVLGFSAVRYREGNSEFDVVFEAAEGRFLGEAEGKDNKAIGVDKFRQLSSNIDEDLEREDVSVRAKGVLFGNAFRCVPVGERGEYFTEKCVTSAQRASFALVRTPDLFRVVRYLSGCADDDFARRCRESIAALTGAVVVFPSIPNGRGSCG